MGLVGRRWAVGALLAAPAIIRTPGLLMPVKPVVQRVTLSMLVTESLRQRQRLMVDKVNIDNELFQNALAQNLVWAGWGMPRRLIGTAV